MKLVDIAIIGTGTAGMRAYRESIKVTDSVLIIEGDHYGTTCARVGCMPSKLLIAAADVAHTIKSAPRFGIKANDMQIDGQKVMNRVRSERDRFVGFVNEAVEEWPAHHKIKGHAHFLSDDTLLIDDQTKSKAEKIRAKKIIIATGSTPHIPDNFKGLGNHVITNNDVFSWQDLPKSVAVVGAGVIGLELSQALHRLGVTVTLFGKNNLVGPLSDPSIRQKALEIFQKELDFHPHSDIQSAKISGNNASFTYQDQASQKPVTKSFEHILVTTGRRPNIDNLGLENTTLSLDKNGMPSFDPRTGQIEDKPIFMAGDVTGDLQILHEASDEGMIAGMNAGRYPEIRSFQKRTPMSVVFTDPQIMMVGHSFAALQEQNCDFEIGAIDWSDQGRSRVMNQNQGLLHVYGDPHTGHFLGAEMIGPRAEHMAHLLASFYQSSLKVHEILERPFYHPVFEEGIRTAFRDLAYKLRYSKKPPLRCIDCGPGA